MTIRTLIFLLLALVVSTLADSLSCADCVSQGCVYCKGSDFFENGSVCVCEGFDDGFFGSCSDFSFGADPLESELDCKFGTPNGESRMATIIVVPTVVILLCCCGLVGVVWSRRLKSKTFGEDPSMMRTTNASSLPTTTTNLPSNNPTTGESSSVPSMMQQMQLLFSNNNSAQATSRHATTTRTTTSSSAPKMKLFFGTNSAARASAHATTTTTTNNIMSPPPPATNPNYVTNPDNVESNVESVVSQMMQDLKSP